MDSPEHCTYKPLSWLLRSLHCFLRLPWWINQNIQYLKTVNTFSPLKLAAKISCDRKFFDRIPDFASDTSLACYTFIARKLLQQAVLNHAHTYRYRCFFASLWIQPGRQQCPQEILSGHQDKHTFQVDKCAQRTQRWYCWSLVFQTQIITGRCERKHWGSPGEHSLHQTIQLYLCF